ncbi:MAG TPA: hypothetical protein VHO84_12800 [Syntrophorhabdaceae bacterium]|nr:hypothetical protein [Syntrophorhabdaceae bacterium]
MTTQQIVLLVMAVIGVACFFAGRILAGKSVRKASLIPASLVTAKGMIAYLLSVVSWAGAVLTVVCIWLFFS